MKVIEFRVWDGAKMHYDGEEDYDFEHHKGYTNYMTSHIYAIGDRFLQIIIDENNYEHTVEELFVNNKLGGLKPVLMQDTGLQDKNNARIYEGDIISAMYGGNKLTEARGIVEFETGAFFLKNIKIKTDIKYLGDMDKSALEVIGNKFDNPKLLQEAIK